MSTNQLFCTQKLVFEPKHTILKPPCIAFLELKFVIELESILLLLFELNCFEIIILFEGELFDESDSSLFPAELSLVSPTSETAGEFMISELHEFEVLGEEVGGGDVEEEVDCC